MDILPYNSKKVQELLKKANGSLHNLNIEDYETVISSAAKYGIIGVFENQNEDRTAIVLKHIYSNSNEKIAVYAKTFSGVVSNTDTVNEGWDIFLSKPNVRIEVLVDKKPQTETTAYKKIYDYIQRTGNGTIRETTKEVREELKEAFVEGEIHHFSLGDNDKLRFEIDDSRKAWCAFSNEIFNEELRNIFNIALNKSTVIL